MKALVAYDSKFGNTREVALAIGEALAAELAGQGGQVDVVHVTDTDAATMAACDLLVFGTPVHGGRPAEDAAALLKTLPRKSLTGVRVIGFDTRATHWITRLFGYAAPRVTKTLVQAGGTQVGSPGDFYVAGTEGPLLEGELDRAAAWAKGLVAG
jgi:flavodoxin